MATRTLRDRSEENWAATAADVARAEAQVDRLTGRASAVDDVDRLVDQVIAGHGAVLATLERDLPAGLRDALEGRRSSTVRVTREWSGAATSWPDRTTRRVPELGDPGFRALAEDADPGSMLHPGFRRDRERRAELVAGLTPTEFRPRTRPPVITRGGVFYVAPRFEQARGLGEVADARLIRAGFLSADAFLDASVDELAERTGHSVDIVRAAKEDLDLTRLPGIDRQAADLLRFVNVHSVSRLAARDPEWLAGELARVAKQHRLWDFPDALASPRAVSALVKKAEALAAL